MSMNRRTFLRSSAAAGLISFGGAPPAFLCRAALANESAAAKSGARVLVILQLEGGNDGLNTVIPYADEEYYKARPGIGIARDTVLRLDDALGFHPQLTGFKELYDEGMLAVLQGIGYPQQDRSHFRSMDIWQSASLDAAAPDRGWVGRALDLAAERIASETPALALGVERLPLALTAANTNVPMIADIDGFRLNTGADEHGGRNRRKLMSRLAKPNSGARSGDPRTTNRDPRTTNSDPRTAGADAQVLFLQRAATSAYRTAERLSQVTREYRPTATYPYTQLANQLKLIAQMIGGELGTRIFFVSLGGFDTHSQQPGAHQALLGELAAAVRAFYSDLAGHGLAERVVLASYSEFGRRVKENGSLGTDHGAASQMFIVTPGKGGLYGAHPSLTDLDDGDLKFHTDFRSVYATLLEKWLGFAAEPVLGNQFALMDFV
jgi:uncharacterized protein (DUF1501 family)